MLLSHLCRLVFLNQLSSEPLVKDVNHLPAKVDEEEGQGPLGHDEDQLEQDLEGLSMRSRAQP